MNKDKDFKNRKSKIDNSDVGTFDCNRWSQ